jgi:hypothetical protein
MKWHSGMLLKLKPSDVVFFSIPRIFSNIILVVLFFVFKKIEEFMEISFNYLEKLFIEFILKYVIMFKQMSLEFEPTLLQTHTSRVKYLQILFKMLTIPPWQ